MPSSLQTRIRIRRVECKGAATSLHRTDAMRICLYWNHTAGGGLTLDRLTSVIERAGHRWCARSTMSRICPAHLGDAECVVVAGGDGTVARAGRVLAGGPVPLAILPLGTANNIAQQSRHSRRYRTAGRTLEDGQVVKIDVGVVEVARERAPISSKAWAAGSSRRASPREMRPSRRTIRRRTSPKRASCISRRCATWRRGTTTSRSTANECRGSFSSWRR